mgnify:CR=1 FL=1
MKFLTKDEKTKVARSGRIIQSYTERNYEGNPKKSYQIKVVSYDFKLYWVETLREEGKEPVVVDVYALD